MNFDSVIIGGGAAGLMCAIEAGKRGRKVAVVELAGSIGKKILISGGGRCNFTNIHASPANYISANPHFCKSALAQYTPFHFIELVEKHNISYHEKTLGQQFCDSSSRQIVDMLKKECDEYNVHIFLNAVVGQIEKSGNYHVAIGSETLISETLVIAAGGLSIPKMGATDFGHKIAKKFGLSVLPCRPGLVPLTVAGDALARFAELSGISTPVEASCNNHSFKESLLFTHRGVSGPAVLQVSSYWNPPQSITCNLIPHTDILRDLMDRKSRGERSELKTVLGSYFSKKLADMLCQQIGSSKAINEYADKDLKKIATMIHHWEIKPSGTEGFPKAEVTIGGVDTKELSSKTMEAKNVSGLFFIGEVVDVTGHLGGFNFQWAWASGNAAGQFC